jgi:hypothetical protein
MSLYGHQPYYFASLRKYVVLFGRIFSQIRITEDGADGDQNSLVRVPLDYSGRDKNLLRVDTKDGSPEAEACPPGFLNFPHMGFELTGVAYDAERNNSSLGKVVRKDDTDLNKLKRMFNPAPYNLSFSLYIMSKNIEDGNKIIEQILPFFRPHFTTTLELIPEMDINVDIPVNLDAVTFEDRFKGELTERRNVFWTLTFTMNAYFYGPLVSKPIVKVSNTNFYVGNAAAVAAGTVDTNVTTVSITPGLDANGAATTNSAVTIPYANIAVDDTFGYIETWTDATDANTSS